MLRTEIGPIAPAALGVVQFSWVIGVDSDDSISQTYHKKIVIPSLLHVSVSWLSKDEY